MARKLLQILGLALLAVALFSTPLLAKSSQSGSLPDSYLKADELRKLVYNTTAEVEFGKTKNKGLIYFSPNGELKLIKHDILYKGYWKVRKNDRLCTQIEGSSWDCRIVAKVKKGYRQYIVKKSGKHRPELTYRKFHSGKQLTLHRAPLLPRGTLNARQLKKLFSDKSVESVTAKKGRLSQTYYAPNGSVEQLRSGVKRAGKWRVTDEGRICLQMEDRKEKCRIIVKEGDKYKKYIVKKNGDHQHSVTYRNFAAGKRL